MPGIQQTFKRIPPGPLTVETADEINAAVVQLSRILNLNVAAPLELYPNADSFTIARALGPRTDYGP